MSQRPQPHRAQQSNAIARFIDRYGWRAYALPVLALMTVVALFRANGGHNRAEAVTGNNVSHTASHAVSKGASPNVSKSVARAAALTSPSPTPAPVKRVVLAADPGTAGKQSAQPKRSAAASPACDANTSARKVIVSIAAQHAWMCAGKTMKYSSAVTTGKSVGGHETPTGTFKIQGNVTNTTLRGSDYAVHVAYWIEFNGDIGFHDASWQTMAFGAPGYTTEGSRGCVHMPVKTIAWLHRWVQIGQTVVVVSKT